MSKFKFSDKIDDFFGKIKKYIPSSNLMLDIISRLIISFGVVLIVGGIYLMISPNLETGSTIKSIISTVSLVPGIPLNVGDIAGQGAATIGLVSWIVGIDLLLVGLGLWVRHRFARFVAITIFTLAAFFQFLQFLLQGYLKVPTSIPEFLIDLVFVYFLFSKFELSNNSLNSIKLKAD